MGLFCEYRDDLDPEWWFDYHRDEAPLATKRSRKCCSCGGRIAPGEIARRIPRWRKSTEWEQDRGLSDERPMSNLYFCETCGDLADSINEAGFEFTVGESLKAQIAEYRAAQREST